MEGFLEKQSTGMFKSWQRRFFWHEGIRLHYTDKTKLDKDRTDIDLRSVVKVEVDAKQPRVFTVRMKDRAYTLRAGTDRERDTWMAVLSAFNGCDQFPNKPLPLPIPFAEACICAADFLMKHGLKSKGVFRVSGNADDIDALCVKLLIERASVPDNADVDTVAGAFKKLLRCFPETLFTTKLFYQFVDEDSPPDHVTLHRLVKQLPEGNRRVLHRLVEVLAGVCRNEGETKMDVPNLSTCIGPNLSRRDVLDLVNMSTLFRTLIIDKDLIFSTQKDAAADDLGLGKAWGHGNPVEEKRPAQLTVPSKVEDTPVHDIDALTGSPSQKRGDLSKENSKNGGGAEKSQGNKQKISPKSPASAASAESEMEVHPDDVIGDEDDDDDDDGGPHAHTAYDDSDAEDAVPVPSASVRTPPPRTPSPAAHLGEEKGAPLTVKVEGPGSGPAVLPKKNPVSDTPQRSTPTPQAAPAAAKPAYTHEDSDSDDDILTANSQQKPLTEAELQNMINESISGSGSGTDPDHSANDASVHSQHPPQRKASVPATSTAKQQPNPQNASAAAPPAGVDSVAPRNAAPSAADKLSPGDFGLDTLSVDESNQESELNLSDSDDDVDGDVDARTPNSKRSRARTNAVTRSDGNGKGNDAPKENNGVGAPSVQINVTPAAAPASIPEGDEAAETGSQRSGGSGAHTQAQDQQQRRKGSHDAQANGVAHSQASAAPPTVIIPQSSATPLASPAQSSPLKTQIQARAHAHDNLLLTPELSPRSPSSHQGGADDSDLMGLWDDDDDGELHLGVTDDESSVRMGVRPRPRALGVVDRAKADINSSAPAHIAKDGSVGAAASGVAEHTAESPQKKPTPTENGKMDHFVLVDASAKDTHTPSPTQAHAHAQAQVQAHTHAQMQAQAQQMRDMQAEMAKLQSRLAEQETQIRRMEEDHLNVVQDARLAQIAAQERVDEMDQRHASEMEMYAVGHERSLQQVRHEHEAELRTVKDKVVHLTEQLSAAELERNKLATQCVSQDEQVSSLSQQTASLRSRMRKAQEEREEAAKQLTTLAAEHVLLKEKYDDADRKLHNLLTGKKGLKEKYDQDVAEMTRAHEEHRLQLQTIANERDHFKGLLAAEQQKTSDLETALQKSQQHESERRKAAEVELLAHKQLQAQHKDLEIQLARAGEAHDALVTELNELRQARSGAVKQQSVELQELKNQLAVCTSELLARENEVTTLKETVQLLQKDLVSERERRNAERDEWTRQANESRVAFAEATHNTTDDTTNVAAYRDIKEGGHSTPWPVLREKLQQSRVGLQSHLDTSRRRLETLEVRSRASLDDSQRRLAQLQKEIAESRGLFT